jgi:hypothetical protein
MADSKMKAGLTRVGAGVSRFISKISRPVMWVDTHLPQTRTSS